MPDIEAARSAYAGLGAALIGDAFEVPGRGFKLAYVDLGNTRIELQQPLSADTVSGRFLAKNPRGGINHTAYEVEDAIAARDWLLAQGGTILGPPEGRAAMTAFSSSSSTRRRRRRTAR